MDSNNNSSNTVSIANQNNLAWTDREKLSVGQYLTHCTGRDGMIGCRVSHNKPGRTGQPTQARPQKT